MKITYKGMMLGKHCIVIDGNCFYYDYDRSKFNAYNFREDTEDGTGKVIARTYKSFKSKMGITHSQDANNLSVELCKSKKLAAQPI